MFKVIQRNDHIDWYNWWFRNGMVKAIYGGL
jgi:hypothetical protein